MNVLNRPLIAATTAFIFLIAGSGSAQAATSIAFTAPAINSSYNTLSVSGTITFTSAKSFKYNVTVKDHCPGDGKGGAAYFVLDGPSNNISNNVAINRIGCGKTVSQSGTVTRPQTIKRAHVRLCWTDNSNDCTIVSTAHSGWKSNSYA